MNILLTPEERRLIRKKHAWSPVKMDDVMCQAQLKKVVKWGEYVCAHDNGGAPQKQWACPVCRIELKKQRGVE